MGRVADEIRRSYENTVLLMRLRAGFKHQKDLASETGISPSILCDIESNRKFLSSSYALRIAEVLGCTINDLFARKNLVSAAGTGMKNDGKIEPSSES